MTNAEQREAARQFVMRWKGRGNEDEDGRSYWLDFLSSVMGMDNPTERVNFERKVVVDGHTKRIDVYIPETHVLIEQKSLGKKLDQKILNSGGVDLTPYEQAKRYNDNLPYGSRARWIITCNFSDIWIYDMDTRVPEPLKLTLEELQDKYQLLDFLIKKEVTKLSYEMEVSIKAGDIVGIIYEAFLKQYKIQDLKKDATEEDLQKKDHKLKSLNALCVRLVFCLYAEDAGVFGERNMFHDYLEAYSVKDCRRALIELFKVLDTPYNERDEYLEEDLAQFPYVNGGLFADENIEIPPFTEEIKDLLLIKASEEFDWSDISPTIFGAVFESTLNPETRRSGGMHYTSIENIHKVIDPLFMDELKEEFNQIQQVKAKKIRNRKLEEFQNKLASLTFLDPACGSGNFLTETYLSLRRLENEVIREKIDMDWQMTFGKAENPIKVSIQQFYGIEINDFAVTVAKTALWIAESQMLDETKSIVYGFDDDFLPLKTYVNIEEANALKIDWNSVVPADKLSYIMGNPPFVGARLMNKEQKKDVADIFGGWKNTGNLDYVSCWYKKAADYITNENVYAALVSTNSISQGDAVPTLWKNLFDSGIHINFAYQTFNWNSEASIKANVHCVIIGFSRYKNYNQLKIYTNNEVKIAKNINAYLIDATNVFIEKRNTPICDVPKMGIGSQPIDNGNYLFDSAQDVYDFIKKEPKSQKYFHLWYGSKEFISRKPRYCLYLGDCTPAELGELPNCMKRIEAVKEFRLSSNRSSTVKSAETPAKFGATNIPKSNYIIIPKVSSQRRRYIPMGFMTPDNLCSDLVFLLPNAELYHFGILQSNVHMAWMRAVCGRLKSDYRYSNTIVYNNFPWPTISNGLKEKIERTAQGILDARDKFPDSSLADLYDPLRMPTELLAAHTANNKVVMKAYGFPYHMTETECVEKLMEMYENIVSNH